MYILVLIVIALMVGLGVRSLFTNREEELGEIPAPLEEDKADIIPPSEEVKEEEPVEPQVEEVPAVVEEVKPKRQYKRKSTSSKKTENKK